MLDLNNFCGFFEAKQNHTLSVTNPFTRKSISECRASKPDLNNLFAILHNIDGIILSYNNDKIK